MQSICVCNSINSDNFSENLVDKWFIQSKKKMDFMKVEI